MKEVRAIVRPNRLTKLRQALRAIPNFPGVTVYRAEGFTAPASVTQRTVAVELTDFTEKYIVSVICGEEMVDPIVQTIIMSGQTGQIGDGLVWVLDIGSVWKIRDGQTLNLDG